MKEDDELPAIGGYASDPNFEDYSYAKKPTPPIHSDPAWQDGEKCYSAREIEFIKERDEAKRQLLEFKMLQKEDEELWDAKRSAPDHIMGVDRNGVPMRMLSWNEDDIIKFDVQVDTPTPQTGRMYSEGERDEFAIMFAQWFHEQDPEWNHDADQWMIEADDSDEFVEKRIGFTDAQLITEYLKQNPKP